MVTAWFQSSTDEAEEHIARLLREWQGQDILRIQEIGNG
jgi:hypothetical protein